MRAEDWQQIDNLFGRALELPPSEQRVFIETHAGEPEIASRLLRMLESDHQSSFLDVGSQPLADDLLADELLTERMGDSFGPYVPKRSLGQGGMGVVYLAEHTQWHIPVALKVPRDVWISPDRKERFAAEQRLLARLTHPAIARIYEGGTGRHGTPWFAMEYVEGNLITTYAQSGNLSVEQRLALFRQACEAVQYAHAQAVIHRDLKPSNIFVTSSGQVKLLDFGIAKQIEGSNSAVAETVSPMLTLAYAAPEQLRENHVSVHSDIYSLGVVLYELLTGRLPFAMNGQTIPQAAQLISTQSPPKPSTISPLALKKRDWGELDVLVLKALHRDVAQRYQSVDALLRDLDHYARHEPLDARPDSTTYRFRKFLERRKLPVTIAAVSLAMVVSLIVYFTWHLAQARDEAISQAKREHEIQQFMTDLFEGDDATNGPSKDLRVVDVLAAGVERARQFDSDPLLQGDLYRTLGDVYTTLGVQEKAAPLLQLALQRFKTATGPESAAVAETLLLIGKLEDDSGQYAQAEKTDLEALRIVQRLTPPQPGKVALTQTVLARALIKANNRYAEALEHLQKAAAVQSVLPETHQDWLDNLNLQAIVNLHLHRYGEAERLAQFLISDDKKQHPSLRPTDAEDIMILGQVQEAELRFAAAEQSYRQALQIDEAWLPHDQQDVAEARRLLAQALVKEGRYEEAAPMARQALQDLQRHYGDSHRRVAYALRVAGKLAQARHNLSEARADYMREIAIYRKLGNGVDLPIALNNLGDVEIELKDDADAALHYQEALEKFPHTEWAGGVEAKHAETMLSEARRTSAVDSARPHSRL